VDAHEGLPERPVVSLRPERASRVIGLDVAVDEQRSILGSLGFGVDAGWDVTGPTWRARDVTREIDVVEESRGRPDACRRRCPCAAWSPAT
jgi:phenylalanyl-tRNA synthetase beta chain